MATQVTVTIAKVENVRDHSNADRLQICDVLGWQMVVPKDIYHDGDTVIYFPPDTIIPAELADKWNVRNYLKGSKKNRVGKIELRGEPSFGLAVKPPEDQNWPLGTNVAEHFGATKYEPPVRTTASDAAPELPLFQRYTDIENLRNYPHVFEEGERIICTEKIHGTSSRCGIIEGVKVAGSMELRRSWPFHMAKRDPIPPEIIEKLGQGNVDKCPADLSFSKVPKEIRKLMHEHDIKSDPDLYEKKEATGFDDPTVTRNTYWFPWTIKAVHELLTTIFESGMAKNQVILYGEVYGAGIQKNFYYDTHGKPGFRAFDLLIDGRYVDWNKFIGVCDYHGVQTVPVLYRGPYSLDKIKEIGEGDTTMGDAPTREGVVIQPVEERTHPDVGRLIMKYLSDAYLLGKHSDFKDV